MVAAVCHDYAHDGFNNGYHVAVQSNRFGAYGADGGVQERFHFAESFRMIEQTHLLEGLSTADFNLFRRRMQQCIYATDMVRHMSDLNELKALVESIPAGTPLIPEGLDEEHKEKRKTRMLDLAIHTSDISFLARPMKVS